MRQGRGAPFESVTRTSRKLCRRASSRALFTRNAPPTKTSSKAVGAAIESLFSPSFKVLAGTLRVCSILDSKRSRFPSRFPFRDTLQPCLTSSCRMKRVDSSWFAFASNVTERLRPCGSLLLNSFHSGNPLVPKWKISEVTSSRSASRGKVTKKAARVRARTGFMSKNTSLPQENYSSVITHVQPFLAACRAAVVVVCDAGPKFPETAGTQGYFQSGVMGHAIIGEVLYTGNVV